MKRRMITIDEDACTGCGDCIPNCPEGALRIIDGKARLVSDLFCDGLGACLGHCPEGAITTEEREAEPYDESAVMANIVRQGPNVVSAHLRHLKDHGAGELLREALSFLVEHDVEIPADFLEGPCRCGEGEPGPRSGGCPGAKVMRFEADSACAEAAPPRRGSSRLRHWPVQIMLVPPNASFLAGADLLIAADCVPFAYADFHEELLKGKALLVGCPKLDDAARYREKLTEMFKRADIRSITVAHMEVPCCFGMVKLVESALADSGKDIPLETRMIGVTGEQR